MASKMLNCVHPDCVFYECACGRRSSFRNIYFCKYCIKLRCWDCVSHEVDTHYCPNCLENMPSAEARLKKNLCANCFDCPSCHHTLSTRASSIQVPSPEDANKCIPKKVYYLACGCCRWTSRDIDLKDQAVASGGWPEPENPHAKQISLLLDYYRASAHKEKMDKEKRKYPKRLGSLYFSDKYGLTTATSRKKAGLPPLGSLSLKEGDNKPLEIKPSEAIDNPEPLPEAYFTDPVHLPLVCTISQRHAQPEFQPEFCNGMLPRHKHLQAKQSHRCRGCDHNVIKPEYNTTSIKFKIQFSAFYHVPEVRILTIPTFFSGKVSSLVVTLCNPSQHPCHLRLLPLEKDQNDPLITADVELPSSELCLAPHDDAAADFDEVTDNYPACKDDPSVIAFQKANKIGVFLKVTPRKGEGEVRVAFHLKWEHLQFMVPTQSESSKEPEMMWLDTRIDILLGPVEVKAEH